MSRLECRSPCPVDVCGISGVKVEDLVGHCGISSNEPRRVEWSPRQSVDDLLGPVVQCAEGLVRGRTSSRRRRRDPSAAGWRQVATLFLQSFSANPTCVAVGLGALQSA